VFLAVDDVDSIPGSAVYDPVNHRFLRLCAFDGVIYADTSADGVDWLTLAAIPAGFDVSDVNLSIYNDTFGSGGVTVTRWANVGLVPVSPRWLDPRMGH
jgi:hypothetical protein